MLSNINDLPTELIEYILDFLHDSEVTLQACSLTCRSWLKASQYHLFDSILLDFPLQFAFFLDVLEQSHDLARSVHHVRLGDFINSPANITSGTPRNDMTFHDIPILLSRFEAAHTLELWCFRLHEGNSLDILQECIGPVRLQFKILIISLTCFTKVDDLISLVMFFPNIEKLMLHGTTFVQSTPSILTGAPDRLASMGLKWFPQISLVYKWFQSFSADIRSLDAIVRDRKEALAMIPIVNTLESVQHLRFTSRGWYQGFSLAGLANLQSVSIGPIVIGRTGSRLGDTNWTPETAQLAVSSISSSHIAEITCPVFLLSFEDIESGLTRFSWQELDKTLAEPRFSGLSVFRMPVGLDAEDVKVRGKSMQAYEEPVPVSSILERLLPRLHESGVLKITIPDWMEILPYYRVF